jgi:hypothetical protein
MYIIHNVFSYLRRIIVPAAAPIKDIGAIPFGKLYGILLFLK